MTARGAQCRIRRLRDQIGWNRMIRPRRDDEKPRPRLRHEMDRVDQQRAEAIARRRQRLADRRKIPAAVGRQRAAHVFQHDRGGRAAFGGELAHQPPEAPERARSRSVQARARAGQRRGPGRETRPRRDRPGPAAPPAKSRRHPRPANRRRPSSRRSWPLSSDRNRSRTGIPSPAPIRPAPFPRPRRIRNRSAWISPDGVNEVNNPRGGRTIRVKAARVDCILSACRRAQPRRPSSVVRARGSPPLILSRPQGVSKDILP